MKKGFTLVELLAIVVILGILGAIGMSIYSRLQKEARQKLYEEQLVTIEKAVRTYITENEVKTLNINGNSVKIDLFNGEKKIEIPMSTFISEGVFDKYPVNPNCSKEMTGIIVIDVKSNGSYDFIYNMSNTEETFCKGLSRNK